MEWPKPKERSPVKRCEPGQRVLEAHVGQLAHGAGCQPVAAGLLAWEDLLLHDADVPAGLRPTSSRTRTRRARRPPRPRRRRARRGWVGRRGRGGGLGGRRDRLWSRDRRPRWSGRRLVPEVLGAGTPSWWPPPSWRPRPGPPSSWPERPSWPTSPSWPAPSSSPSTWPPAAPSWRVRREGSRREASRGHRRSAMKGF